MAWWKFDEGTGTTTADSSGNGNTATLVNNPTWTTGHTGGALSFDGINDYLNAGSGASINLTGSFTITAWINTRSFGTNNRGRIVSKLVGGPGYAMWVDNFYITSGLTACLTNCATPFAFSSNNIIRLNTWQHIAMVYNTLGNTVNYYVDGAPAGSSSFSGPPQSGTSPLYIGASASSTDRQYDGLIDDLRIYNLALSQSQINQIYAGQ